MGLPWFRVDCNIAGHDKILHALTTRGGKGTVAVYLFSIGWAHGHGTDGHIPRYALPVIHATPADVRTLTALGFWDEDDHGDGWWIHHYTERQEMAAVSEAKRAAQRRAARKTNCERWHGKECGCWRQDPPSPEIPQLRITH